MTSKLNKKPQFGRRTGIELLKDKTIRKHDNGTEMFADYWSNSGSGNDSDISEGIVLSKSTAIASNPILNYKNGSKADSVGFERNSLAKKSRKSIKLYNSSSDCFSECSSTSRTKKEKHQRELYGKKEGKKRKLSLKNMSGNSPKIRRILKRTCKQLPDNEQSFSAKPNDIVTKIFEKTILIETVSGKKRKSGDMTNSPTAGRDSTLNKQSRNLRRNTVKSALCHNSSDIVLDSTCSPKENPSVKLVPLQQSRLKVGIPTTGEVVTIQNVSLKSTSFGIQSSSNENEFCNQKNNIENLPQSEKNSKIVLRNTRSSTAKKSAIPIPCQKSKLDVNTKAKRKFGALPNDSYTSKNVSCKKTSDIEKLPTESNPKTVSRTGPKVTKSALPVPLKKSQQNVKVILKTRRKVVVPDHGSKNTSGTVHSNIRENACKQITDNEKLPNSQTNSKIPSRVANSPKEKKAAILIRTQKNKLKAVRKSITKLVTLPKNTSSTTPVHSNTITNQSNSEKILRSVCSTKGKISPKPMLLQKSKLGIVPKSKQRKMSVSSDSSIINALVNRHLKRKKNLFLRQMNRILPLSDTESEIDLTNPPKGKESECKTSKSPNTGENEGHTWKRIVSLPKDTPRTNAAAKAGGCPKSKRKSKQKKSSPDQYKVGSINKFKKNHSKLVRNKSLRKSSLNGSSENESEDSAILESSANWSLFKRSKFPKKTDKSKSKKSKVHSTVEKSLLQNGVKVLDYENNDIVRADLLKPFNLLEWERPGKGSKNYKIRRSFLFDYSQSGFLQFSGLKKKPLQYITDYDIFYVVVKGHIKLCLKSSEVVLKANDTFNVPSFNLYSIENLRKSEALLAYFTHYVGSDRSTTLT